MGVETLEAKLLDAIAKQNALLLTVNKKHPDFAFLLARDVQLQQAQCWLSLSRIRRLAVATSSSASGGRVAAQTPLDRAALDGAAAYLAHARRINFEGDGCKSKSYLKGQVFVLVEEAELFLLRGLETDALASYDEAIHRCSAQRDHAMESHVHDKLKALRLDLDTRAKLDELAQSPHENLGDHEILQKCFDHATQKNTDGLLRKEQLAVLARDLGAHTTLSSDETDELWKQIRAHDSHSAREDDFTGISFHALWRWWMAEEMYEFRSRRMRRHA